MIRPAIARGHCEAVHGPFTDTVPAVQYLVLYTERAVVLALDWALAELDCRDSVRTTRTVAAR